MTCTLKTQQLKDYASFIKLEHTVFSLPLIFAGTLLQLHRWPSARLALLIVVAAASGRVMAMSINRMVDAKIDARNPRTQQRELPRGVLKRRDAWLVILCAGALYLASAAAIAPICFWLTPIPVALFVLYPYLKRFTALAHLGLGLAWSMGPLGGWLAAAQSLQRIQDATWLWLFSILWVTGFDMIYATMDEAFDRAEGLYSLPARVGKRPALRIAAVLHAVAFLSLCVMWLKQLHTEISLLWLLAIAILFIWQHAIAERKPAFAFFQLNGIIGFLVLGLVVIGA